MAKTKKRILAIGSHPDDIEFGCAGTLISCADQGHDVFLLVMTKGRHGGEPDTREQEQLAAKKIMDARKVFWGGYEDTQITLGKNAIETIEAVLKEVRPDVTFCHYKEDTHQDHRHLTKATMSATRYVPNVLLYEGPTTHNFTPHVFMDIEKTLERKIAALGAHQSQVMRTNIKDMSIIEIARSCANFRGIQGRVKYAEAFHAVRFCFKI